MQEHKFSFLGIQPCYYASGYPHYQLPYSLVSCQLKTCSIPTTYCKLHALVMSVVLRRVRNSRTIIIKVPR